MWVVLQVVGGLVLVGLLMAIVGVGVELPELESAAHVYGLVIVTMAVVCYVLHLMVARLSAFLWAVARPCCGACGKQAVARVVAGVGAVRGVVAASSTLKQA